MNTKEQTREEFIAQYEGPQAQEVARLIWDVLHPRGMHVPVLKIDVRVDVVRKLLQRWTTGHADRLRECEEAAERVRKQLADIEAMWSEAQPLLMALKFERLQKEHGNG